MMKTRKEWFNELEEPIRSKAIKNVTEYSTKAILGKCHSFESAISSFSWFHSEEGFDYWEDICINYKKIK